MDQEFEKINDLLEDTDYPVTIRDMADLEEFLLDDANRRFKQYAVIGRIYDDLCNVPEIDRYPEPSEDVEEEELKNPGGAFE